MQLINFPIGDWSNDGHGKCETYLISTDLNIEDVREAHFAVPEKLGFDIGDLCNDYGNCYLDEEIQNKILDVCTEFNDLSDMISENTMIKIWIGLLNYINPALNLKIENIAAINFCGRDKQNRHLNVPGYGLFE